MIVTTPKVGNGTQADPFRPDFPEGVFLRKIIEDHGDTMIVEVGDLTEAQVIELVNHLPSFIPSPVRMERFWVALHNRAPAIAEVADQLVESNVRYKRAAMASTISRSSQTLAELQQAMVAMGHDVTDELLDQVFRDTPTTET